MLALVARGYTNARIAEELWLSPYTVKSHLQRIGAKLGTNNRAAAVAEGLRSGWITADGTARRSR